LVQIIARAEGKLATGKIFTPCWFPLLGYFGQDNENDIREKRV